MVGSDAIRRPRTGAHPRGLNTGKTMESVSFLDRSCLSRRQFLAGSAAAAWTALQLGACRPSERPHRAAAVQTVLGPVAPQALGATLMHEHAPTVDWSELYATPTAPLDTLRERMLAETAGMLNAFHQSLSAEDGPGAIVECTPIRVGRYPQLMADLARRTPVHIVASTGFWCEALAPQHPWAVRLGIEPDGAGKMADLFVREISEGMEDPHGGRGERFTTIRAGAIKVGTSALMRPSEKAVHIAAARASRQTGCPITTHTTNGGGLEQARLLLESGADPGRVIIGHQGHMDDGKNAEAVDYHLKIARLGCYLQFDRVGAGNYDCEKQARLIHNLVAGGFERQVLVSHDHVPYFYREFSAETKGSGGWRKNQADFTIVTTQLAASLEQLGVSANQIRTILVENSRRVLAF